MYVEVPRSLWNSRQLCLKEYVDSVPNIRSRIVFTSCNKLCILIASLLYVSPFYNLLESVVAYSCDWSLSDVSFASTDSAGIQQCCSSTDSGRLMGILRSCCSLCLAVESWGPHRATWALSS